MGCLSVIYSVFSPLKVASQDDKISNDVNYVIFTHNLVWDIAVAAFVVIMLSAEEWIIVV